MSATWSVKNGKLTIRRGFKSTDENLDMKFTRKTPSKLPIANNFGIYNFPILCIVNGEPVSSVMIETEGGHFNAFDKKLIYGSFRGEAVTNFGHQLDKALEAFVKSESKEKKFVYEKANSKDNKKQTLIAPWTGIDPTLAAYTTETGDIRYSMSTMISATIDDNNTYFTTNMCLIKERDDGRGMTSGRLLTNTALTQDTLDTYNQIGANNKYSSFVSRVYSFGKPVKGGPIRKLEEIPEKNRFEVFTDSEQLAEELNNLSLTSITVSLYGLSQHTNKSDPMSAIPLCKLRMYASELYFKKKQSFAKIKAEEEEEECKRLMNVLDIDNQASDEEGQCDRSILELGGTKESDDSEETYELN